jgi:hypothetical protein
MAMHIMMTWSSGTLFISSNGNLNDSDTITASKLLLEGAGSYTLNNTSNSISTLAMMGDGGVVLMDHHALTIGSVEDVDGVDAGGGVQLTTTTGNISITQLLEADGHPLTLTSAGTITESGSGAIDAMTLIGSSHGAVTLNGANVITDLGAFTTGGNNAFSLTDAHDLTTNGVIDTGSASLTLTTTGSGHDIMIDSALTGGTVKLVSAATIGESTSLGRITAVALTGSSVGMAMMNSATNMITDLGMFTSGGMFELTDDHDLTVDGTVNAGAHTIELTTKGSGHDIAIDAKLEAGTVDLMSAATITESSAGIIDTTTLDGSSVGMAMMNSATNMITDLGTFTSGSTFELTDDHDLTVDGTLNAGTHTIELNTKGSGHDIAIDAKLEGGTVKLTSAATISESSAGDIDTTTLEGSSVGTVKLTSATNTIADLSTFSTGGNNAFELTDDHALTVDGKVTAGTGTLDLTTVGSGHSLAIDSAITGSPPARLPRAVLAPSSPAQSSTSRPTPASSSHRPRTRSKSSEPTRQRQDRIKSRCKAVTVRCLLSNFLRKQSRVQAGLGAVPFPVFQT